MPGLSRDPPQSQGISVGGGKRWRRQGRYVKLKIEKIVYFIAVESLGVPPLHTHILPDALMFCRFAWIAFSGLSLITRCQNSKLGRYRLTSGSKLIGYNAPRPSVGQATSILSHDPSTPATKVAKRRAQGRNSQSEQNGRWLADANLYTKKKHTSI